MYINYSLLKLFYNVMYTYSTPNVNFIKNLRTYYLNAILWFIDLN